MFEDDEYDTHNFEDDPHCMGITSIESLQHRALYLFGRFLARISNRDLPEEVPPETEKYLPVAEIENILRDHGKDIGGGFVVGGETREEMQQQLQELMAALVDRVLSNVIAEGVKNGLLDYEFSTEKNDFVFAVTELGKKLYDDKSDDDGKGEDGDSGV